MGKTFFGWDDLAMVDVDTTPRKVFYKQERFFTNKSFFTNEKLFTNKKLGV